jgi:trimethylamine--corrinoid protein Co-methyltransferase
MFNPLSPLEVEEIHNAAYRILEQTGLSVKHELILEKLEGVGCRVDFEKMVVKFPPEIITRFLALIPRSFTLGRRDSNEIFQMTPGTMFTRPQSGCPNVIDLENGKFRTATQDDVSKITRLIDGLENVDFCASLLYPWDAPPSVRDIRVLQIMFNHSNKHAYVQPYDGISTRYMIRMAEALRSSVTELRLDSPVTIIVGGTSPLVYSPNELEVMIEVAKVGVPIMIGSTPIAGATAPITLAGQILIQHVENLAGLVILQVLQPGCPVTYAVRPSYMEMRTANATWGNIEWGMTTAATAQLARSNDFLVDVVGLPSDSKVPDVQAAIEKSMNAVLGTLSAPNVFTGIGAIETIKTGSFIQTVIDDEICGMVKRIRKGIGFDEDRLAEELIQQVGISGNYLVEQHTLKYFRTEIYNPRIYDHDLRIRWEKNGSIDLVQRARERSEKLLIEHEPQTLDEKLSEELEQIYQFALSERNHE